MNFTFRSVNVSKVLPVCFTVKADHNTGFPMNRLSPTLCHSTALPKQAVNTLRVVGEDIASIG